LDTQGFYKEVVVVPGNNFPVFWDVLDKIRKAQRNNYASVVLNLNDYSQNQIKTISGFCKNLYEFSFVAKYFYNKNEKRLHLTLQAMSDIVGFFNGEWLEGYLFMKLLKHFYESKGLFSCLRSFNIQFANEDKYEVDVFFRINGRIPVFIGYNSGEFRRFIEKYRKITRRLDIEPENLLLLVFGVSDGPLAGLTKMYDITLVKEVSFVKHVIGLIA
jgi:hypothetical protein